MKTFFQLCNINQEFGITRLRYIIGPRMMGLGAIHFAAAEEGSYYVFFFFSKNNDRRDEGKE
jgi:hypothetical protein